MNVAEAPTTAEDYAAAELNRIEETHARMVREKAELLRQIRHFDELGLARAAGSSSTAQALIRRLGISNSTAHEYVKIGCRLGLHPVLEAAFVAGEVSYSKVRLLLPYLTEENEDELVQLARELGYHELEIALTGRQKTGGEESDEAYYLRLSASEKGGLKFWGHLNPSDGAALIAALKLGEIAWNGLDMLEDEAGELLLDDDSVDLALANQEQIEPVRPARKTVSGFGLPLGKELLRAFMGVVHMIRTKPTDALIAPAAHVNILMTKDGRAYMPNNLGAPAEAIANIAANAALRHNIVDDNGLVIKTGRQFRLAKPAQVNALLVMWGSQCAAPGCTHTRFLEMHHLEEWRNGGCTDLENLIPLCSACHSLVTDGYITITRDGSDLHFSYGDGTRYVSHNYSLPRRKDDAVTLDEFYALIDGEDELGSVGN